MDHALPIPHERIQTWRLAALVMTGIAALELLLLIVGGALLIAKPFSHTAAARASAGTTVRAAKRQAPPRPAILPRGRTRVLVLNGNGQTGAAGTEADAVRARGYRITAVGNASQPTTGPSLVMYRPRFAAEAKRLARDTGIGTVTVLDGLKPGKLGRAHLVIVVGSS